MLAVVVDGNEVLEYRPHDRLPGHVRRLLAQMDADMADGLAVGGEQLDDPDTLQCARYVAMKLVQAIASNNKSLQAVTCAWLCSRLPELRLIKVEDRGTEIDLELIME